MTLVLIFASAYYGNKNYKMPTLFSLFAVGLNVLLNALFVYVFHLGAVSIALATALSACLNSALLAYFLSKKYGISLNGFALISLKTVAASLIATLFTLFMGARLFHDNTLACCLGQELAPFIRHLPTQLLAFGSLGLAFTVTFLFAAYTLRLPDFFPFLKKNQEA